MPTSKSLPHRRNRPLGPTPRRTPTILPRTKARKHFRHVPEQIVIDLPVLHNQNAAATGPEQGVHQLEAKSCKPIAMLHENNAKPRLRQHAKQLAPRSIEPGTYFNDHFVHLDTMMLGIFQKTKLLPIQVRALVSRRYACVQNRSQTIPFRLPNKPVPSDLYRIEFRRQTPERHHLPCRPRCQTMSPRPHRQLHALLSTLHTFIILLSTNCCNSCR